MLLDPRVLFVVGATFVGVLMATLYSKAPIPAKISATHAQVIPGEDLQSCQMCHHEEGLNHGCLECHQEIGEQLQSGHGYHEFLSRQEDFQCGSCHAEHLGETFALVNDVSWGGETPFTFDHPHVEFDLEGKHKALACMECHLGKRDGPFAMAAFPDLPRDHTFLGLSQDCRRCHQDPHAEGFSSACGECHGQEAFYPPQNFDHSEHLPLVGNHQGLDCAACHIFEFPEISAERADSIPHPFPFDRVAGTTCGECHTSPHRADFGESCHECHSINDPVWAIASSGMTLERHARTGFSLDHPHDNIPCQECHAPLEGFEGRHPNPNDPQYLRHEATCRGCHEDTHQGQFVGRYERCLDCHTSHSFSPTTFDVERHSETFALRGAHGAAACIACHEFDDSMGARQFVGTSQACRDCHATPHGPQFQSTIQENDCRACHGDHSETFAMEPFDHVAWTGYSLEGAHAEASCEDCHRQTEYEFLGQKVLAHRYEQTPTHCAGCHTDVHRGQFDYRESCTDCHQSQTEWLPVTFDHDRDTRFPLEGAHVDVACASCHKTVTLEDDVQFVHYRPLGRDCRDCHEIDPRTNQKR